MPLPAHIGETLRCSGRRVVVTGASGWLGRAALDRLAEALGEEFANRVVAFGSRRAWLPLADGRAIEQRPLPEIHDLPSQPTLVLHFAFLGKERAEAMDETEYRAANRAIQQMVLAALDPIGAEAVFVSSSGAARFADDPQASPAMRLYGSLKRDDERSFAAWADAMGKSATIARVFNLSGAHINKLDSYALSSFILDALAGKPVAVRARHDVVRGYVAVDDLLALAIALAGKACATRFDSGGEPIELGDLAATIANRFGVPVERSTPRESRADVYLGDDAGWQALLAREGIASTPLPDQIAQTAAFLESAHAAPQVLHA